MSPPHDPDYHDPGHTVLAVPVPVLNDFVRERTAHYDQNYLATDLDFGQAHITLLGPWVRDPATTDLATVADIARRAVSFEFTLADLGVFPNGIIHLIPEPTEPFAHLTAQLAAQFPQYPPYAGQFAMPTPHLTLDAIGLGMDAQVIRRMLGGLVPVTTRAERIQLQWWQAGRCHVRHTWWLGQATGDDG